MTTPASVETEPAPVATDSRWRRIGRSLRTPFALGLLLITLAGFGIRIAFIHTEAPDTVGGDALFYHEVSKFIADGRGFTEPYRFLFGGSEEITLPDGRVVTVITPKGHVEPTAGHPPVYPMYLAVFSFVGLDTVRAHQWASALLGSASIVVAGLLGRSLRSPRLGLIAAALTAVYANIWVYDGLVLSETAALLFVFLTTYAGLRFWRAPTSANAAIFGVVGGLAALSRAELLLFVPVVTVVALWRAPLAWRDRFLRLAVAGAACVLCLLPWVVRNNMVMEEFVTLSNGSGTVLVQSNCDDVYYGARIGFWSLRCGDPQPYGPNGELLDESERDIVVRERALEYISTHKTRLVTVVVPLRVGRMLGLYQPWEQVRLDIGEGRPTVAAWMGFWQYVVLVPIAAAGAVIQWRRRQPVLVLGLWIPMAMFTAASTFGMTRYRIAAEVSVVLFAALALDAAWCWWRRRQTERTESADELVVTR